jgi:sarcosine oxidase gamma subunit
MLLDRISIFLLSVNVANHVDVVGVNVVLTVEGKKALLVLFNTLIIDMHIF